MPHNLLAEFTLVYLKREDEWTPPFVSLSRDRGLAEGEALAWARGEFGAGTYRVVGGAFVGRMQANRWGERL